MDNLKITLDNLYFLGSRNYIQGGTIYESILPKILQIFPCARRLDFTYRALVTQNLVFLSEKLNDKELRVALKIECERESYRLYGYHQEKGMISKRIPYNEKEILKSANIDGKTIVLRDFSGEISVVRLCIVLYKGLLSSLFGNEIGRSKWFLSRLTLTCLPDEREMREICLCFQSRFEFLLAKAEILVNSKSIGFIYFSLKDRDYAD